MKKTLFKSFMIALLPFLSILLSACNNDDNNTITDVNAGTFKLTNLSTGETIENEAQYGFGNVLSSKGAKLSKGDTIKCEFKPKTEFATIKFKLSCSKLEKISDNLYRVPDLSRQNVKKDGSNNITAVVNTLHIIFEATYDDKINNIKYQLSAKHDLKVNRLNKEQLGTDFMMTYVCPNNILELGDVVMSYYSENGKEMNDTLSINDFTQGKNEFLSFTISGSGEYVKQNQMYWQKKLHYDKYNVQQQFLIWFLPKVSSYSFASTPYFDAMTKDESGKIIDSLPFSINIINQNVFGNIVNSEPKLLFGAKYNVDANGKISSEPVKEENVKAYQSNEA